MKLPEIKKFIEKNKLPKQLRLNKATNITDIDVFFDSHICVLEGGTTRNIKMLHYDRLMLAISLIKKSDNYKKSANEKIDNLIDTKPTINKDTSHKSIQPNVDFDSMPPVKRIREIPPPSQEKPLKNKKQKPDDNIQKSLF